MEVDTEEFDMNSNSKKNLYENVPDRSKASDTMAVDTSGASGCLELFCLSICAYIESVLRSIGVRRKTAITSIDELSYEEAEFQNKTGRIEGCLKTRKSVDLWELRELALSEGGLLQAQYRQMAWPKLVGLVDEDFIPELVLSPTNSESSSSTRSSPDGFMRSPPLMRQSWSPTIDRSVVVEDEKKSEIEANVDLIRRDAGRSVIFRYTNTTTASYAAPLTPPYASQRLAQVLENTIRQGNASLHYYQGLHDIAGVILHNMDYHVDATTQILKRISHSHLRDAMRENFSNISWFLSVLLPPLVEKVDSNLHYVLKESQIELSSICLPWMITWFTHDIHDPNTAARLVDAFLSGHPLMPIYFAVALITHPAVSNEILFSDLEDPTSIFMTIKGTPMRLETSHESSENNTALSLQEVLEDCITIMNSTPPRSLLDLVDANAFSRSELLRRISSISLFKAPASWSMASGGLPRSWKELNEIEGTTYCVRAKLASGVPMLMSTVSNSSVIHRVSWGSNKYFQKKKSSNPLKLKKLIRSMMRGNIKNKNL